MKKLNIFAIILIIFLINLKLSASKLIIGNCLNYGNKPVLYFLAEKESKRAFIVKTLNLPEILKNIKIITGEYPGDKIKSGDKRTPEGIYFIKRFIPRNKLAKKYGLGAYVLNYPNIVDKIFNKTGYGIWIHGIPDNTVKYYTQGCVASYDRYLKTITNYLKPDLPVIITKKAIWTDKKEYFKFKNKFLKFFSSYIGFWQEGDFLNFKNFYNNKFLGLNKFLKKKKLLFKRVKYRRIRYYHLTALFENKKDFLVKYKQFYCASNILSFGEKNLYFQDAKIIAEKFKELGAKKIVLSEILSFIKNWKKAWESKKIENYKKFYSKNFKNLNNFLKDKKDKFKRYRFINVKIKNLNVKIISPVRYKVKFIQYFKSDKYEDVGVKTLILENCPGDFKIRSELWKRLK